MKNRASNYSNKALPNQINGILDRKKSLSTEMLCEKAMAELQNIYWFEKQLLVTIPILIQSATTFELVETLTLLIQYTRKHVKELETKFPDIDKITESKKYNNELHKKYE